MRAKKITIIGAAVAVLAGGAAIGAAQAAGSGNYALRVAMPTAAGLYPGSIVQEDGTGIGSVTAITTNGGEALVDVSVSGRDVPFHSGTTAEISWDSLLGPRRLNLLPGPASNPVLPSGHLIVSTINRTELDQVLAALTPKTRQYLDSLVSRLQSTLNGNETDVSQTLRQSGPTFNAIAQLLQAVGSDGPALRKVVTQLNSVVGTLASRQNDLRQTVSGMGQVTSSVASQQSQLGAALGQLPSTLSTARTTMNQIPSAVNATIPLLNTLAPAVSRLPALSDNLGPLMTDLRPGVAMLNPTLESAQLLLNETPGLLDSTSSAVPGLTGTLREASPAVAFLRPYTPDLIGWLTEWAGTFSPYDSQGHFAQALINASAASVDSNPGVQPPFLGKNDHPEPGNSAGQPWTDADGSGMR